MDLFDIDPERLRHSKGPDDGWWDRLIASSPLWSSDGSSAREPFPVIGFEPSQYARQNGSTSAGDRAPGNGTSGPSADTARADTAGRLADGAGAAGAAADGADATRGAAPGWDGTGADAARGNADGADATPTDATDANAAGADGPGADGSGAGASDVGGRGRGRVRSSWVVVGSVREVAQELTLVPLPDDVDVCLAEAEELLFARDRITCALADRVGRVHAAGQAKQHGHASTRSWLRTAGGMTVGGAGRLLMLGAELPRLPVVREKFAVGGAAEVAKAGRHLRAVLDPDGEERDEQADYGRRFLRVRPGKGGGVEGEFYIPREPGARLMTLLQEYAKKKADGDDRTLTERQADALIAALEQQIVTELLVVVSAESLPTDPENTDDPYRADPATEDTADHVEDARDAEGFEEGRDDTNDPAPGQADDLDNAEAEAEADAGAGSDAGADGAAHAGTESADDTGATAATGLGDVREAEADPATAPAPDSAPVTDSAPSSDNATAGLPDEESRACGFGSRGAREGRPGECESHDTMNVASAEDDDTAPVMGTDRDCAAAQAGATHARWGAADGGGPSNAVPSEAAQPDPPPEDASAPHTHAGHRPAGDCRHGQGACRCDGEARCSHATQAPGTSGTSGSGRETPGTAQAASQGASPGAAPGGAAGTLPGAFLGTTLGASLGMVPGLLLATGQVLPISSVHRLARTSTLVRIVMNAEGQVLDMGRKVRLATPAQRRAVLARYATCWIDGCPLPATMCQIDHADNWSSGGLTDLKLLGPACQFHNRDRYQHPERYTRRKEGTDRWAFTYHRLGTAWRLRE
ncbi:HNH endonuclease signature motif containing protein [Microbispora hainanensis]